MLLEHRLEWRPFGGFPDDLRPGDENDGSAIQDRLHEKLTAAGYGILMGSKIGCTTAVMQAYLSIAHPSAGGVFDTAVHQSGASLAYDAYQHVGVECELAVRMGRDLPAQDGPPSHEAVAAAIGSAMAAIEIVDDRYVDYTALDAYTLIADDFFAAGCVLGPEHSGFNGAELAAASARMLIDGREVGRGSGTDILGEPLAALGWLAQRRQLNGRPLKAGELVLLGSLVQTHWVARGQVVVVENDLLGTVHVRF